MNDEMLKIKCQELTDLIDEFPEEAAAIMAMLCAAEEGCTDVSESAA